MRETALFEGFNMNCFADRKRGIAWWQKVLLLAALGLLAVFFPVFLPGRHTESRRSACQVNLKQIMLGVLQYTQDYEEHYPSVAASSPNYGWADAIQPYLKATQLYQCPSEITGSQPLNEPTQRQYTDYWFNARLSKVSLDGFSDPTQTIVSGDGNDGTDATDARYHLLSIPGKWLSETRSPLFRHLHYANFAFADGHVKSFRTENWKNALDMKNGPTFRLNPK